MYSVMIGWGSDCGVQSQTRQVYTFGTMEELNAFLLGASESNGWMDLEQTDPGDECPECQSGTIEEVDGEFRCRGECGGVW